MFIVEGSIRRNPSCNNCYIEERLDLTIFAISARFGGHGSTEIWVGSLFKVECGVLQMLNQAAFSLCFYDKSVLVFIMHPRSFTFLLNVSKLNSFLDCQDIAITLSFQNERFLPSCHKRPKIKL